MTVQYPRILAATALASSGLRFAGCGSNSSAPERDPKSAISDAGVAAPAGAARPAAGSGIPCSLLTQAEVDTAVGQPLGPGESTIPHYDCAWSTSDFAASVSVTVSDWSAIHTSATTNGTATSVAGVGDEALTKGGGLLYVRKGDAGFLLLIGGPRIDSLPDHGLAAEKVPAAAVLRRL